MAKNPFLRGKKWVGYVELPKDPITGDRRRKWFRADKEQIVKKEMNIYKGKLAAGNFNEPAKITLESWLNKWLDVYCATKSPTTIEGYRSHIHNHIVPHFKNTLIGEIKPMHIQEYYNKKYKQGHNLRQERAILNKAFNDAIKDALINSNPCNLVELPEQKEPETVIYTKKQYNKLLYAIKGTKEELPIILGGMCGLRRSEIMGIRWSDIDLDNNIIYIRQVAVVANKQIVIKKPKNKTSFRSFKFPSKINEILKRHRGIGDSYVFPKDDGSVENGGNYSHRFKNLLKRLNLPHIKLHSLRHFTATMLLENGVDTKVAQEMLGYSSPQILQKVYQHVTSTMQEDAANKLNNVLKNF